MAIACDLLALVAGAVLLLAASRRGGLAFAAAVLYRPAPPTDQTPRILIACACRNEKRRLPRFVADLAKLAYRGEYRVVLVDDASDDGSAAIARQAQAEHPGLFRAVALEGRQRGKADALREGLAGGELRTADVLLVLDADHRLEADALHRLVNHFALPDVQAVAIEHPVEDPERSLVSAYCYLEAAVSELVTSRGQNALGLPTKLAGSWACRPDVFERLYPCGWQMADDTVFTAAIVADGGFISYAGDVTARQDVPDTLSGYVAQHLRWSAGYAESAQNSARVRGRREGALQRLDALATHAGYFERPLLVALLLLAGLGLLLGSPTAGVVALAVLGGYVLAISAQIAVALRLSRASPRLVAMSLASLPLLLVDVWVSVRGVVKGLTGARIAWSTAHR